MTRPAKISLIAAVARNGVIGHNNQLLWHLPADLAHFRDTTRGCAVLMGRKTWESLPPRFRPLPGRRNLVMSQQGAWQAAGAEVVDSLNKALVQLADEAQLYIIGGEQIYRAALPLADELVLTELDRDFEGDAHFPNWSAESFQPVAVSPWVAAEGDRPGYRFATYQRLNPSSSTLTTFGN
jgi:dihydrofolate reductase